MFFSAAAKKSEFLKQKSTRVVEVRAAAALIEIKKSKKVVSRSRKKVFKLFKSGM